MNNSNVTSDVEELAVTSLTSSNASASNSKTVENGHILAPPQLEDDEDVLPDDFALDMDESEQKNGNSSDEYEDTSINLDDDEDFITEHPDLSYGE